MPLIETSSMSLPYLAYDAPVNEKTKQLREMFKVDEETGYPEHYNWRGLARLGPKYTLDEPFYKIGDYNPNETLSTKVVTSLLLAAGTFVGQWVFNYRQNRTWYSRIHRPIILSGLSTWFVCWYIEKAGTRAAQQNSIIMDYVRKHPDRFEPQRRFKIRECLFIYEPTR